MNAMAINGSPRKEWNTATLLENALAGAGSHGLQTEMVHLYDFSYKGCTSCFSCKLIDGRSYGRCALDDELTPILERAVSCDVLILGSPIYWHTETGEMRSFIERLLFPVMTYAPGYPSIAPKKIAAGLIYTMNVSEEDLPDYPQHTMMNASQQTIGRFFGSCDVLLCTDTYQFSDYSKYVSTVWDVDAKAKRRSEVFPQDCQQAYEFGARLAAQARAE